MIKRAGLLALAVMAFTTCAMTQHEQDTESPTTPEANSMRLLYWNIQNGMWSGQDDNYDKFVNFVKEQNPDICVWCEAVSIYKSGSTDKLSANEKYLPEHWGELAERYGHKYWYKGGHRDNYPQVITSRFPIENVKRITGAQPDSIVSHGAGWAQINKDGRVINIVTLHTWPQRYGFNITGDDNRAASAANNEGDRYRRKEIEYICNHTIATVPDADKQLWMMMGDFNSKSPLDNNFYKYRPDTTAFLCQNYILTNTPYIDVISEYNSGKFISTTGGHSRIDFVYFTQPLMKMVTNAKVIRNTYTNPVRDPKNLSNFWHPSDHCPILVDFRLP